MDNLQIVEEAFAPGAVAKRVAERHEISTGLLFTWRRQLMADASARFQPVHLSSDRRCSIRTYDRQRATASCAMHRQFSFFVRLRRCFSVPTFLSSSASRAAAVKTGCIAAIAVATRSGLDGREHGARLSWVGSPPPALRQRSLFGKQSELETASPSGVTAPRAFPLDDW